MDMNRESAMEGIWIGMICSLIIWGIIILVWMSLGGCAWRMTVTPIQAEEITQKTMTNQMFDWLFNSEEGKK